MKKRMLRKSIRQKIIAASLFFLIVALVGLYWTYSRPSETVESYTAFPYTLESTIDYQVHLRPNNLYEKPSIGPGRAYLSSLTDYIDTKFSYLFSAESAAELRGEYYVTATIKALTGRGEQNYLVWEKNFPLLPLETFEVDGTEVILQKNVVVPFAHYVALTENIVEETGFSPSSLNLEVDYHVALTADTPDGTVVEEAGPKLTIPLVGKIFTVEGSQEDEVTGGIEATRIVPTPYYQEAKTGLTALSIVLGLFLLVFFLMTVAKEEDSIAEKKLSRLLKQYRDRIVESAEKISFPSHGNILTVSSFDGLLKVADELEKPIVYQNEQYGQDCEHSFFVFSDECTYRFNFGRVSTLSIDTPAQKHFPRRRYAREQG